MQYKRLFPLAVASVVSAQTPSLTDALGSQNSSLSSLNDILSSNPEIAASFNNLKNVTILAPSNDALESLVKDTDTLSRFTKSGYLQALLSYHVLNGTYHNTSFTNESIFIHTSLDNSTYSNVTGGQVVEARLHDNNVTFFTALKQNASIVTANVNFTGGTIHIIDGLLSIPQNVSDTLSNSNLTAAEGAIQTANLTDSIIGTQNVTIFAPNNDAFAAIGSITGNLSADDLKDVIGYHVLNGSVNYSTNLRNSTANAINGKKLTITVENGTIYVNSAKVTVPDILLANGVVHVIDGVLNPNNTSATPDPTATSTAAAFSGASSGTDGIPFTSGVTTPTSTFPAATSAGGSGESSSSKGAAMPMKTGAIGAAALFGGAAAFVNL
ncbi:FAS1 domain-containing protein [Annulohypoxylon maeteangense]|uniref:FAS1 domain-containing protein n=1 Tax=Annulohypoxylon maeteangense TaxID=1927788 RepID=UPI0020072194|nr:FAS1 domain-containing protein [Annulohypoxylon maeteangense]KAI0884035.1 FAS1 domain-containing protein [Annulohypoxylon maeteangense]